MKAKPEHDPNYTLQIKLNAAGNTLPLIKMHFESLQDAFDKLLIIQENHLGYGFGDIKSFRGMDISEVSIIDSKDGRNLISSAIAPDNFDPEKKLTPGIYFKFPQSVSTFEKEAGFDFSGFKGYDAGSQVLMCSGYHRLIGYENLLQVAKQRITEGNLFAVALTRYHYSVGEDCLGQLESTPYRQDYFFDSPDKALRKLLTTDFNSLDKQVAWENDLEYYTSQAILYQNTDNSYTEFYLDYHTLATLHSARKHGLVKSYFERYNVKGIYVDVTRGFQDMLEYPLGSLEKVSEYERIYKVGFYNESLSRAEKIPGLLAPYEKKQKPNMQSQVKKSGTGKGRQRSI